MIKKINSLWRVDIQPGGRSGKRIRKSFKTQAEAKRYKSYILGKDATGEWNPVTDNRRLSELIELWHTLHGYTLKNDDRRKTNLLAIAEAVKNPKAIDLKPALWLTYQAARLNDGVTKKTLNNELGYLRAVYNFLHKNNEINYKNPLANIAPLKIDERELSFLTDQQITSLSKSLDEAINPHVKLITMICLSTGARWSEAENLTLAKIKNDTITYTETKSKKARSVPVSADLTKLITKHLKQHKRFTSSLGAFRTALKRADIEAPKGQCSHLLRHTYASHFIMNGGNILTLQRILGHSDIKMTMRYAHLAPDYLADAIRFAPALTLG